MVYGLSVGRCGISFPVPCGFGVLPSLRRTGVRVVLSRRVSFLRFIVVGIVTFLMAYSHWLSACFLPPWLAAASKFSLFPAGCPLSLSE